MSNFEPNAILRGAQLTLVGAHRALQNPKLFTSDHYKQVALAVLAGIVIRLLLSVPTLGIRMLIRFVGLFTDLDETSWDEDVVDGIKFVEHSVLQVPFFLMSLLRLISPTMDNLFMDSLAWVDSTYSQKHKGEDSADLRPMYAPNLRLYENEVKIEVREKKTPREVIKAFSSRFGRRAGLSLAIYLLSFLPYIGRFILPAASFYTFNKAVGLPAAAVIFGSSVFLPKRYLVMFLQSYFSSRSMMRELLDPYFQRVKYTKQQKKQWFRDRAGVLYGFGLAFFILVKVPLLGVLIYGIAEASTAYLITKITEPPPQPQDVAAFRESDVHWKNKHEFLSVPLETIDTFHAKTSKHMNEKAKETVRQRTFH